MIQQNKPKNQFLAKCFNKKTLIQKTIIAAIALVLVLSFSLSFYFWLKDKTGTIGKNPFWYIEIVWNDGIGWSALSGNLAAIYAIQSIMFILMVGIYVFLCNDKITASFIALAMFGGLFNLMQRATEMGTNAGCVLDYFHFGFWENFPIFNWPDMFVVIGIFGFVISFITLSIIDAVNESRKEQAEARKKAQEEVSKPQDIPPHEIR